MLEMVTATRFDRPMTNGKTKPCLMACDCADGAEVEVVVKLSGGCERGVGGLVVEAIVAMFAADLELPVPEPYLVCVEPELVQLIPEAEIRELFYRSSTMAFGSRLLPPSHSVWLGALKSEVQHVSLMVCTWKNESRTNSFSLRTA